MLVHILKITLLTLITLLFTACMPKQNGKYKTKYSYHPYHNLYGKKVVLTDENKVKVKVTKVKKSKPKTSSNPFNTVDFYPSNVPARRSY